MNLIGDHHLLTADIRRAAGGQQRGLAQQVAEQVVGGGDADRQIRPIGQLTEYRGLGHRGVEAQPVHADIFGIFATTIDLVRHIPRRRTIDQAQHLLGQRITSRLGRHQLVIAGKAAQPSQLIDIQASVAAVQVSVDGRFFGVVIDEVEPELGGIELFSDITQGHAKLTVVLRIDIRTYIGDLEHAIGIEVLGTLQAGEITGGQARIERLKGWTAQRFDRGIGGFAAGGEQIGFREEGTHRIDGRLFPVPLVEGFQGQVVAQADIEVERLDRHQHLFQLGTWQADPAGIHRVGSVDTAAIEQAFAPVEHLPTDARRDWHIGHIPVAIDVGVENFRTTPGTVAGFISKAARTAEILVGLRWIVVVQVVVALVHDLRVIERRSPNEQPVVLISRLQIGGELVDLGNQAGIEVTITVVGIYIVLGLVDTLHAPQLTIGHGGIDGATDFIVGKAEFNGLNLSGQQQRQNTGKGETSSSRRKTQYRFTELN